MLQHMLDTDICSYAIKRKPPELLARIRQGLSDDTLCISVMTRGELLYGLALLPDATSLHRAVLAFLGAIPTLDWTSPAADHYGRLRAAQKLGGNPMGYMDTQIAAHALATRLILVTNNHRHYSRVPGLALENWA